MIAFIIGRILLVEAAALLVPMLTALICGEPLIPYLVTILLLIAAGFTGCQKYTAEAFGVDLSPRGTVVSEEGPDHYRTNVPGIFTAGDMHRGQSLVVWNIVEGRGCAREVDEYLMGYTML
jgi:hypothetical protein